MLYGNLLHVVGRITASPITVVVCDYYVRYETSFRHIKIFLYPVVCIIIL